MTSSLQLSKLPRPATVINNSVTLHPTIIATLCDCLKTLDEWKLLLLEHTLNASLEKTNFMNSSPQATQSNSHWHPTGAPEMISDLWLGFAVDRKTLWKCKGPTLGLQPGSFAERKTGLVIDMVQQWVEQWSVDGVIRCSWMP
jgi:hypothetical protein